MDCGPTSLRIIAQYYGRHYSLQTLRERCHITHEGVSLLGISDAAESVGIRSAVVRVVWEQLRDEANLPCIVHWNQRHFVVVYRIARRRGKALPLLVATYTAYWPTISLSAGYGSSFSNVRQKMFENPDGTFRYETYPFFEQYKDNASCYVSLSLNIPICGKLTPRKNVQRHKLAVQQAEYTLKSVEKQVTKEVTQAFIDARTSWQRYLRTQKYVTYSEEVLRQIERKYDIGVAAVTYYNAAVSAAVKARSQLLQAKYEYFSK